MNSRDRVAAALARQPVDKVPLGFYAADCDTVGRVLGRPTLVRNKPGIQLALWEGRRAEVAEALKTDVVEFYRKLDCVDLLTCKEAQALPPADYEPEHPKKIADDTYQERSRKVWKLSWDTNEVAVIHDPRPIPEEYTPEMFPDPEPQAAAPADPSCFEVCDHLIRELGDSRYILTPAALWCMPLLDGMENGLLQWALAPEAVAACARQTCKRHEQLDPTRLRPGCPGGLMEEDMGGTNGLLVSPAQWREISLPVLKRRVAAVKQHVSRVVLHCCGKGEAIIPDLAAAGVDCYQSLQTLAGMTPEELCPRYGDRIAFWGGAATETLVAGTAEEMRAATRRTLQATRDYPGFIFGPSHSIAHGAKYDVFMAMLDEFDRNRNR